MEKKYVIEKYCSARTELLTLRNKKGYWVGELSTSALSTAIAIVSLKRINEEDHKSEIAKGLSWLCENINTDGGFGDTSNSISNISTTLLCYGAFKYCQSGSTVDFKIKDIENWLLNNGMNIESESITKSILNHYGKDFTFSIPILSMLTICGVLSKDALKKIPALPFELTVLPKSLYRFLNLGVVSYAIPALISVGIYLHVNSGKSFLKLGKIRRLFIKPSINILEKLLPESGGLLEAIPLTGFVIMCLVSSGVVNNNIVLKGKDFLKRQQRENGGWPIDVDLSTWLTTLSAKALGKDLKNVLDNNQVEVLRDHLLKLQYKYTHPFNGAKPGGWGWTNFSGSVPDADDTPGAIIVLLDLFNGSKEEIEAITNGCTWLIYIQNVDGGFPTFCKGWGKLPFDSSCADLTGHALLSLIKTRIQLEEYLSEKKICMLEKSILRAIHYLSKSQSNEGSWLPLWFGNQNTKNQTNPIYGTAKVCIYLEDSLELLGSDFKMKEQIMQLVSKAHEYIIQQQNSDGSWGAQKGIIGSIEETALAISALAKTELKLLQDGVRWLIENEKQKSSPIGLYFSLLWYDEKLYPKIYYVEALRRYIGQTF